jgi:hypothetical protein
MSMRTERKKARVVRKQAKSRSFSVGVAGAKSLQPKSAGSPLAPAMGARRALGWGLDSQSVRRVWAIRMVGTRRRRVRAKRTLVRVEIFGAP